MVAGSLWQVLSFRADSAFWPFLDKLSFWLCQGAGSLLLSTNNDRNGYLCLNLSRNAASFPQISKILNGGLLYTSLIVLRYVPSILILLKVVVVVIIIYHERVYF